MDKRSNTIILANGEFPYNDIPLGYLNSADRIICCDGAVNKLVDFGLEPNAIIGDLDSIHDELRIKYSDRLFEDKLDQDSNDLTKAVKYCIDNKLNDVVILGATGLREDHTIGNISLLIEYVEYLNVKIVSNHGVWIPLKSSAEIGSWEGQQISIFSADPGLEISSEGLRFPLNKIKLENWWMGTLNESKSDKIKLSFTDGTICLFLKFS